jgi:hypothetical protein
MDLELLEVEFAVGVHLGEVVVADGDRLLGQLKRYRLVCARRDRVDTSNRELPDIALVEISLRERGLDLGLVVDDIGPRTEVLIGSN